MRYARAHKLQWSGPTVHSSTVKLPYHSGAQLIKGIINICMTNLMQERAHE